MPDYQVNRIYGEWTWHQSGTIDPARAALIIVSMQKLHCYPESSYRQAVAKAYGRDLGPWAARVREQVIPNVALVLEAFRQHELCVVHVMTGAWRQDRSDFPPRFRATLERLDQYSKVNYTFGSPELDIVDVLTPLTGELVLRKVTGSSFLGTGLDQALRNMGMLDVVLTGLSTDGSLLATAIAGYDHGYRQTLIGDASTTWDPDTHDLVCALFKTNWGRVLTSDQIIEEIQRGGH